MALQFGFWVPVCGGWLRVAPPPPVSFPALLAQAEEADREGYDFCYIPEHYLNAVYGPAQPVADAWVTAAAIAARTRRIRVITAVQPGFKAPGVVAKMGASIDALRPDAFGLSVLAGWWRREAEMHGDAWLPHAERYRRTGEYLEIIRGLWSQRRFDFEGRHFRMHEGVSAPRPDRPPPTWVAGESESAIDLAARLGDTLFVNGGSADHVAELVTRVKDRARERHGRTVRVALSAFALLRDTRAEAERAAEALAASADLATIRYFDEEMDRQVVAHTRGTDADRIEANLGLSAGLVGDRETILQRIRAFEEAGVDAIALKFEGVAGEPARFYREVIARTR